MKIKPMNREKIKEQEENCNSFEGTPPGNLLSRTDELRVKVVGVSRQEISKSGCVVSDGDKPPPRRDEPAK